jgi:TetR/AcrR family transcriptional regulator
MSMSCLMTYNGWQNPILQDTKMMPEKAKNPLKKAGKPSRKKQERTEITRSKLIAAATLIFSEQGYDGMTIRDIENAADVQRGLLTYHFTDKQSLWRAVADEVFGLMGSEFERRRDIAEELSEHERLAFLVRFHVRFHAKHPEVSRMMAQEASQDTWRIRYLVDTKIKAAAQTMRELVGISLGIDDKSFVHWYYIMTSASATIFSFEPECRLLFGVESREDSVVETHANMLVDMLFNLRERKSSRTI